MRAHVARFGVKMSRIVTETNDQNTKLFCESTLVSDLSVIDWIGPWPETAHSSNLTSSMMPQSARDIGVVDRRERLII